VNNKVQLMNTMVNKTISILIGIMFVFGTLKAQKQDVLSNHGQELTIAYKILFGQAVAGLLVKTSFENIFLNKTANISSLEALELDIYRFSDIIPIFLNIEVGSNGTEETSDGSDSKGSLKKFLNVKPGKILGYLLFGLLIFAMLFLYLWRTAKRVFESRTKLRFITQSILLTAIVTFIASRLEYDSIYAVPFIFMITVISYFFNTRIGLFVHLLNLIMAGLIIGYDGEFLIIQLIAGLLAVLIFNGNKSWKHVFGRFVGITLCYFLFYSMMELMRTGTLDMLDQQVFKWMTWNGLITMLAYPLIPVLARFYGFTSDQVLEELSDLNHPLLKEMADKAPGTLQHSIQLSSLVGTVAEAIHANAQLVKVGALYHDVGKVKNPECFIENLAGMENVHDSMNTVESASKIINHVLEGEKLAKKYHLPQEVTHFISTHHGTSRVEYFYRKHLTAYPDSTLDENLFRYPGPVPGTKEEAILMIADSLEASARSFKNLQSSQVDMLVDKIIRIKLMDKQLDDCGLSVKELETCADAFKSIIKSMHHLRVEYPEVE